MKKVLLGVVGLIALGAAPAMAADLPVAPPPYKAAPIIPAFYDWSGLYVGLNGGGGSTHKCWDLNNDGIGILGGAPLGPLVPAVHEGCHNATGGTVGGQIGFRWQANEWVFGVEAQGNWASFRGSNTSLFYGAGTTNQTKLDAFGLFTGQIGYAFNSVLWYVKGGAAVTDDRYNGLVTGTNVAFDTSNETRWGGVVGTGIEFAFAPGWSVGVEYDHLFMGSRSLNYTFTGTSTFSRNDRLGQDVDIGTVRVNYRWGGPVIAKY
jgi:outer membrane immunogenic protein